MKYLTRAAEMEREAELVEKYIAQGYSKNRAEIMADKDVQVEQWGCEPEDRYEANEFDDMESGL